MPRRSCKLFSEQYQTSPGIVSFWYWHAGRAEATIDVDIRTGLVRYVSQAGNSSDWVLESDVVERNCFPGYIDGHPKHGIRFFDIHSKFGVPQHIVFKQVGPYTWTGKHRTGVVCTLILRRANDEHEGKRFAPELPDVIALPPNPYQALEHLIHV